MSEVSPGVFINMPNTALPDPDDVSYFELEKQRKLFIDFDIGPAIMTIERMIFRWNMEDDGTRPENRRPIWLYIMSYGGDLDYMWSLVDVITASITPIYTVNVGIAASAASLIFLAGHQRMMTHNAKVIIHEGSAQVSGDAVKVMDATENYRKDLKKMKDYILLRTKIPKAVLYKKRSNDWTLDSDYCLENGVCDTVIDTVGEIL